MKRPRRLPCLLAAALSAALLLLLPRILSAPSPAVPGLNGTERTLLRIWLLGGPGGAQSWLKSQLRAFEKQHPGVSTYLREASPDELYAEGAVPPDVLLFTPGDLTAPQDTLLPLSGSLTAREELLRAGRWQGQQYGLPLCWGAWCLAVDSALEPGSAATPAPTTLLGKPAATPLPVFSAAPAYPLEAVRQSECALQSPGGTALFTLGLLLPENRPSLPVNFAQLSSAEVYAQFQKRSTATAMLTSGQVTAWESTVAAGKGFPFRVMVPQEIITDQVLFAGITANEPPEAAMLLAFLTALEAQQALSSQNLHTVRDDLTLYAIGTPSQIEQSGRGALTVINAFHPRKTLEQAAWAFFTGRTDLTAALTPLL